MKKQIPNILTLLNLFSGCIGVVFAFTSDLRLVCLMIYVSLVLDYLDGTAARLLKVHSPLGKELDSLADMVSFGLLPGLIAFMLIHPTPLSSWAYVAFITTIFSAYRLAKFNIDERQSVNFIGLPTPANALFWSSFPLVIFGERNTEFEHIMYFIMKEPWFILACVMVFSYLLIAELPLFSLKFKNLSWKDNKWRFVFLGGCVILFPFLGYHSIPFIVFLYLFLSIIQPKTENS